MDAVSSMVSSDRDFVGFGTLISGVPTDIPLRGDTKRHIQLQKHIYRDKSSKYVKISAIVVFNETTPNFMLRTSYRRPSSFSRTMRSCPSVLFLTRYWGVLPSIGSKRTIV